MITNYLGDAGYGQYTVVYEMMSFALIVADFGFFHIALREMGKDKSNMHKILANILSMRLILAISSSIIIFTLVLLIGDYTFETVKLGLGIALLTSIIGLMGTTITAVIQVHLQMIAAATIQVIGKIAMVGYIYIAISQDFGFLHMLYAGFFGSVLIFGMTFWYARRFSRIYFAFDMNMWRKLFQATWPMGVALIFYTIALRSPILIMDTILKDSAMTGQYGVAQRIIEVLIFIPIAFMNSVLPSMAEFLNTNTEQSKKQVHRIVQHSFDFLNAISLPAIAGVIITAPELVSIISNDTFESSTQILQILVSMIFFYYLSTLFGYILLAHNQQKLYLYSNACSAVFAIIVGIFGVTMYQQYGALASHVGAEIIAAIVSYMYLRKYLFAPLSLKYFVRMLAAAFVMFVVLWLLKPFMIDFHVVIRLGLLAMTGVLLYVSSLVLFQALPFAELKSILLKKKS